MNETVDELLRMAVAFDEADFPLSGRMLLMPEWKARQVFSELFPVPNPALDALNSGKGRYTWVGVLFGMDVIAVGVK